MKRVDGREHDALRPARIKFSYQSFAEGSVLIELGNTRVLCAVSVEEKVPNFLRNTGSGWLTAEYAMLPRSTHTRTPRGISIEKTAGRSQEIQRLIGRSLRSAVDLNALGERTFIVDCDVLQADGGTRTLSITGGYLALYQAFEIMRSKGIFTKIPVKNAIAAVSVGIVDRELLLDLCYQEDSRASVDFNVVMTDKGDFVEIQGTAEGKPFSKEATNELLILAEKGIRELLEMQKRAIVELH